MKQQLQRTARRTPPSGPTLPPARRRRRARAAAATPQTRAASAPGSSARRGAAQRQGRAPVSSRRSQASRRSAVWKQQSANPSLTPPKRRPANSCKCTRSPACHPRQLLSTLIPFHTTTHLPVEVGHAHHLAAPHRPGLNGEQQRGVRQRPLCKAGGRGQLHLRSWGGFGRVHRHCRGRGRQNSRQAGGRAAARQLVGSGRAGRPPSPAGNSSAASSSRGVRLVWSTSSVITWGRGQGGRGNVKGGAGRCRPLHLQRIQSGWAFDSRHQLARLGWNPIPDTKASGGRLLHKLPARWASAGRGQRRGGPAQGQREPAAAGVPPPQPGSSPPQTGSCRAREHGKGAWQ